VAKLDRGYVLFAIRFPECDWESLGEARCDDLEADDSDAVLFSAMVGLAENLDDGHTTIRAREIRRFSDAWVTEYPYYDQMGALERMIEDVYLDAPLSWAAEDWFAWGTLPAKHVEGGRRIGYVSITSMDGLSRQESERKDVEAAEAAMERMFTWGGHDARARQQLMELAQNLGMTQQEAQVAEARYQRRKGF